MLLYDMGRNGSSKDDLLPGVLTYHYGTALCQYDPEVSHLCSV